ncbi:MAG: hypothetical protein IPH82_25515 [Chloroflexi bacterium]|nr:hypothetical protein [Chloroflexota bacterium]
MDRRRGSHLSLPGQGITISTFAEVLTTFPDMRLNVEIKPPDPAVAQAACDLLRQHGASERALVGTVHDEVLDAFRTRPAGPDAGIDRPLIGEDPRGFPNPWGLKN